MAFFGFPKVCFILLAASLGTQASALAESSGPADRVLRAATKRSEVFRRSPRIGKKFEADLSYIETENGWRTEPIFASQVKIASQAPILNLEDIEHHLHDVKCSAGSMKLHFVDTVSARDARHVCSDEHGGFIITSHYGCNEEGERAVYRVKDVELSKDEFSIELSVVEEKWKEAFSSYKIDFGHTEDSHLFRRHEDFYRARKRQAPTATSANLATITPAPVDIPGDTPDTKTAASFDLSFQTINSTFDPKAFLAPIQDVVAIPDLPVELGCNNCTTTGKLALTQGSFNIEIGDIDVLPSFIDGDEANILSFIKGGFVELAATDLGAHIDLFARPKVSGSFEVSLLSLPIAGFVIPGFGKAGVTFKASLQASYQITGGIELGYGFDILVPAKSTVRVDLSDLKSSGITGFDVPKLQPLPFKANVTDVEITLGLKFHPTVPVGFDFLDGKLKSDINVFMDLPSLQAKLSTKKNVDQNCNDLPGNSTSNSTNIIPGLNSNIGKLVLVEASVGVALGVGAEFNVPGLPANINNFQTTVNLFSTEFALPTACLAADQGYKSVTDIFGSSTVTSTTVAPWASITTIVHETSAPAYTPPPAYQTNSSSAAYAPPPAYQSSSSSAAYTPPPAYQTSSSSAAYTPPPPYQSSSSPAVYTPPPAYQTSSSSAVYTSPPEQTSGLFYEQPSSSCIATTVTVYACSSSSTSISTSTSTSEALLPPPASSAYTSVYIPFPITNSTTSIASSGTGAPSASLPPPAASQFTGAAAPMQTPAMEWRAMWQMGAVGLSFVEGVMVLL
ncbi:hypothetical protein BDV96DRAFT_646316 [Lophiotrema nucula]|uniref:Uncharacterized protein n=1 Tax=Lophiotrema nucula TaxID=690887 RepID=A0A6A5Z8B1_9PLEO|nr:hypothetical protein BDV96DRAFT_646316 [Lophiotrema nucula]